MSDPVPSTSAAVSAVGGLPAPATVRLRLGWLGVFFGVDPPVLSATRRDCLVLLRCTCFLSSTRGGSAAVGFGSLFIPTKATPNCLPPLVPFFFSTSAAAAAAAAAAVAAFCPLSSSTGSLPELLLLLLLLLLTLSLLLPLLSAALRAILFGFFADARSNPLSLPNRSEYSGALEAFVAGLAEMGEVATCLSAVARGTRCPVLLLSYFGLWRTTSGDLGIRAGDAKAGIRLSSAAPAPPMRQRRTDPHSSHITLCPAGSLSASRGVCG